ncbi:AbrB/MazE/SpoVT family DNA-binding domain-containing protein, partial [Nanoarchaeota archaeon]
MIRRLIKQGVNSYTVTIPISWVNDNNLKSGSEINVDVEGNNLIFKSEKFFKKKSIKVDVKDYDEDSIKYILYISYRNGIQRLVLKTKNFEIIEKLAVKHFIGFEVIEKQKDKIILEVITEPVEERFESLLRKLFLIVNESISIVIKGEDKNEINKLTDRYRQIDNFCRRYLTLMKKNDVDYGDYQNLFVQLLMIQTDLRWMVKSGKKINKNDWKESKG